ncbi:hypothetical protein DVH05_024776 [Phytophthora capsici]|nr:hypothetical protein DVH05_024776 [Phytophthora capsici]
MARKWLQLVSEDGNALTSATYVVVDIEDVVTLRNEVQKVYNGSHLAGIAPSDLTVFDASGVALEEDAPIGSLGGLKKDAIIVQAPKRAVAVNIHSNLDRVGVHFSTRELNYLLLKDIARYSFLQSPALTPEEARQIRTSARSAIKSVTRNAIGRREGVLLDGPLNLSQGQAKSAFYYAFSRFGGILAAKVYGAMHENSFQREVDVNFALGYHKNIVQFVKSFSIGNAEGEQRHVIVMPFFARCAADLLALRSPVELRTLISIAHDCFEALCHIHSKKYCFADMKPANIMLHCGEQGGATLVDFGAAVRLGDPIVEITDEFCLDVAKLQGTELLDWTCLGTTMAQMAGIDITKYDSRHDLVRSLYDEREEVDHLVGQFIVSCLGNPSESRIKAALDHLAISFCKICRCSFTKLIRPRHHCRRCSYSVCGDHSGRKLHVPPNTKPVRVCDACFTLHQSEHADEEEEKSS